MYRRSRPAMASRRVHARPRVTEYRPTQPSRTATEYCPMQTRRTKYRLRQPSHPGRIAACHPMQVCCPAQTPRDVKDDREQTRRHAKGYLPQQSRPDSARAARMQVHRTAQGPRLRAQVPAAYQNRAVSLEGAPSADHHPTRGHPTTARREPSAATRTTARSRAGSRSSAHCRAPRATLAAPRSRARR